MKSSLFTILGVAVIGLALTPWLTTVTWFGTVLLVLIYAMAAAGGDFLVGVAGQATIGGAAIMGVGGFAVGVLTFAQGDFWLSALLGILAAMVAGLLVGLPSLRVGGLYLAVGTLALQVIVTDGGSLLEEHGHLSGYAVSTPHLFPGVQLESSTSWLVLLIALCVVVYAGLVIVRHTRFGRTCVAVRENEMFARTFGANVSRAKLLAFVFSAIPTGLAGVLLAFYNGNVDFTSYSLTLAIEILAIAIVGGLGSILGTFLGAVVFVAVPQILSSAFGNASFLGASSGVQFVLIGGMTALLLYVFMRFLPLGLAGFIEALFQRARRLRDLHWPRQTPMDVTD
jgi:branched-chain amino acid transport system permease protein